MSASIQEAIGLRNPGLEEIGETHRRRAKQLEKIEKEDKITPVSWSNEYNRVWTWLARSYTEAEMFPPPLFVDRRRAVEKRIMKSDGSVEYYILGASMDWSFDVLDEIFGAVPIEYNCHVYHNGLLRTIGHEFHSQIPVRAFQALVRHDLLHELLHFITCYEVWKPLIESGNKKDLQKAYGKIHAFVSQEMGNLEDEIANEKKTLELMWEMEVWYSSLITTTIHGGPYDLFMRERNQQWEEAALAWEYMNNRYHILYHLGDRSIEEREAENREIIKRLRKLYREEGVRFKLIE